MSVDFTGKDIISIYDLTKEDIEFLIRKTEEFRKKELANERYSSGLKNKKLGLLFFEDSTRTKKSFDTAMEEQGGIVYDLNIQTSSIKKHESVRDTILMALTHHNDCLVMRHSKDGSVQWAADVANIPVINGGDGKNQHPTQTMLDLVTIHQILGRLDNISIGFGGDLKYGRTAHSLPIGLSHFDNVTLHLAAPEELQMPQELVSNLEKRGMKIVNHDNLIDALKSVDVFYQTRPQIERMNIKEPSMIYQMMEKWKITPEVLEYIPDGKIMHPLPIDSHLEEISFAVAFSPQQFYYEQAHNGVLLRKALIHSILYQKDPVHFSGDLSDVKPSIGENKVFRELTTLSRKDTFIDLIKNGIVIDHLEPGSSLDVLNQLNLLERGWSVFIGNNIISRDTGKRKDMIKIIGGKLSERDLKQMAIISPDVTINEIKEGIVMRKYQVLICGNENCISRVITEDVPPRFYIEEKYNNKIRCRYCQSGYNRQIPYVSEEDKDKFFSMLEKK
ncbi:MAG: aspartate carbamoyltransferase [Candidatus Woesearchaeota archaeon]